MRRSSQGVLAALLASLTFAPGAAVAVAQPAPLLVIEGKGFGHGVGMAQDGALAMASQGASAAKILGHFYPGTAIARRSATVTVAVHESPGPVVVVLPSGGEVRDALAGAQSPGFPVTVSPGGSVQLALDGGKYKATPLAGAALTRTATPPPPPTAPAAPAPTPPPTAPPTTNLLDPLLQALLPTTVPPATAPPPTAAPSATIPAGQKDAVSARSLWAVPKGDALVSLPGSGRSYRGRVQAAAGGGGLHLTNEVDVEQYVRGLGEMPASWPAAALQAQAIAARTFAVRAAAAGRTLCDDQQCQVYIGAGNEHPATSAAAVATRGQVLTYKGALAEAVYSASAGGVSATPEEGFGPSSPAIPYLTPVSYPTSDPQLWAMTVPLREAGARFGYRGELQSVRVSRTGPSGRPLEITFEGSNGPMAMDGHRFWAELDLRSTLFTLRTEVAELPVDGEALAARVPDLAPFAGPPADPAVADAAAARPAPPERAPWVLLAVLLLAVSGTASRRVRSRTPSPALATAGGPASAAGTEAATEDDPGDPDDPDDPDDPGDRAGAGDGADEAETLP
jgi:SpoIID/LytB domain protein